MTAIRSPAVAGTFYPAEPGVLHAQIAGFLAEADNAPPAGLTLPKAIIGPHAGYAYSGAVAARAYARLAAARGKISRVLLIGPSHYVGFQGLAVDTAQAWALPGGTVPLDTEAIAVLRRLPLVGDLEAAYTREHALEVHVPFLQQVLGDFRLVPIVAGTAPPEAVAAVFDALWGGPETLIVVSTDLSHYLDYATCRATDAATAAAIERFDIAAISPAGACGAVPTRGLLLAAQRRGMAIERLDLRNSGDTAGPRDRVVGYGAWALHEADGQAAQVHHDTGRRTGDTTVVPASADAAGGHVAGGHVAGGHDTDGHDTGGHVVGGHVAGGHAAGAHDTDGHAAGGHVAGEHVAGGHVAGGHDTDGHAAGGHDTDGHDTDGHDTGGHVAGGHAAGAHDPGGHDRGGGHAGVDRRGADRTDPDAERQAVVAVANELIQLVRIAIGIGFDTGNPPYINPDAPLPPLLASPGAAFVTLRRNGALRGCIGSATATRPLIVDVAQHAFNAAFRDWRFPKLALTELAGLDLSVSVLTAPVPMAFADQADLLRQLRPGIDGLIIEDSGRSSLFLPSVWEEVPEPRRFLTLLKLKAGMAADHFSPRFTARRFRSIEVKGHMADPATQRVAPPIGTLSWKLPAAALSRPRQSRSRGTG